MNSQFETMRKELAELAEVLNHFKSDAVQLKLLDWILDNWKMESAIARGQTSAKGRGAPTPKKPKGSKAANSGKQAGRTKPTAGRPGPGKMIDRLISEGFFKKNQTIGGIIDYCRNSLAFTYTTSDLSPTLGRAIRAKKLKRDKNADGQYEYSEA